MTTTPNMPRNLVRDVMSTNVLVTRPDETLDQAWYVLISNHISRLPVLENDKLVGIVTDRDFRLAANSPFLGQTAEEVLKELRKHTVREVMSKSVLTVEDTEPIVDAVKLMRVSKVGGLPVTNKEGKLVGIITRTDLIDHLIRILEPMGTSKE